MMIQNHKKKTDYNQTMAFHPGEMERKVKWNVKLTFKMKMKSEMNQLGMPDRIKKNLCSVLIPVTITNNSKYPVV